MANGTGLTSGPYNLAASSSLELSDPNARGGQVSDRVQIQNQSGFTLTVFSAGAPYTIPALQSSTIPTVSGGQSIIVATSATSSEAIGSVGGSVSAIWLLPGQNSPIVDGPLIVGAAIGSVSLGSKSHTLSVFASTFTDLFAIDYTVQRMTLTVTITGLSSSSVDLTISGVTSGQTYYSKNYTANGTYSASFAVFGSVDSSIQVFGQYNGLSSGIGVSYTLTATESSSTSNDTVTYGGLQSMYQTGIAAGTTVSFLDAPASGLAYRLHSWSVNKAITVAGDFLQLQSSTTGQVYDIATAYSTGRYLGGLLITTDLQIHNQSATIQFAALVQYDIVILPLIS